MNKSTDMILYVETGCPYCEKVLKTIGELHLKPMIKNIEDEGVINELIDRGGKAQVPYIVDEDRGVEMYESDDIIEYLRAAYTPQQA